MFLSLCVCSLRGEDFSNSNYKTSSNRKEREMKVLG